MTQEKHSKILEQIKKLFALGKSPNENEAAMAIQKAQEMMLKYNIDNSDLIKDKIEDIIEIDFEMAKRFTAPNETLSYWIGQTFFVKPIRIRGLNVKIRFIGAKSDIAVASYIYSYIMEIVEVKCKDYIENLKRMNPNKDWRGKIGKVKQDYVYGFVTAVTEKLKKMKEEMKIENPYQEQVSNALMVVKQDLITKYLEEQYKNLKKAKAGSVSYDRNHFGAGFEQGEKTGIYKGIDKSSKQAYISY